MTALGVNIETYPTHIAGMPVAIKYNMLCDVNRYTPYDINPKRKRIMETNCEFCALYYVDDDGYGDAPG